MPSEPGADEAEKLLAGGFRRVKLRIGYPNPEEDLAVTRAVPKRLPDAIELPVDYNQALTVTEAIRRGCALESEGIAWLEEPIRHDDYVGSAAIATCKSGRTSTGRSRWSRRSALQPATM